LPPEQMMRMLKVTAAHGERFLVENIR